MEHLSATFQHQGSFLKHQAVLTLYVRAMHAQFRLRRFGLRNQVLELPESPAQQLVLLVLASDGLLMFLLQLGAAFVPVFQMFELQEHSLAMTEHILVDFHALAFGSELLHHALQRLRFLLLLGDERRQRLHLVLYLIIIVNQESRFRFQRIVRARQLIGRADVVEDGSHIGLSVHQLFVGLLLALLLVRPFLPVLVRLAFQNRETALFLTNLFPQHLYFLVGAVNALEQVVALQHARFLRHHGTLFAQLEEVFLLAVQRHFRLVEAPQPCQLRLQSGETFLQSHQLRLRKFFSILNSLKLSRVKYSWITL